MTTRKTDRQTEGVGRVSATHRDGDLARAEQHLAHLLRQHAQGARHGVVVVEGLAHAHEDDAQDGRGVPDGPQVLAREEELLHDLPW